MPDTLVQGCTESSPVLDRPETMRPSMSEQIWGLDWRRHFPRSMTPQGVLARVSSYAEVAEFARRNFATIYQNDVDDGRFLWLESGDAKHRYYQAAGDFFAFEDRGQVVGVYVCTPVDWSSYYIRNISLLPSYEGQMLMSKMTTYVIACLSEYGVDRIEADVSPANLPNIHILTRLRFNITGTVMSERWGALLHFTRHLSSRHERAFLTQFCQGLHPQVKRLESDQSTTQGGSREKEIR